MRASSTRLHRLRRARHRRHLAGRVPAGRAQGVVGRQTLDQDGREVVRVVGHRAAAAGTYRCGVGRPVRTFAEDVRGGPESRAGAERPSLSEVGHAHRVR
ncbi:hypothetical protein AB0I77_16300 [Streptomyces sp. NPDC050619]|uniref:hypothetical protein n=1 Tax=Streptomyces sp. NPDC050619 TaxID=3157214 RepID=UPI00343513E5